MSNDNTINGLREIMFDTLRGLKDGTIKPDQAKAINDTAQTIINTAKVEVHFIQVTGQSGAGTDFLQGTSTQGASSNTPTGVKSITRDPETGVTSTVHRMR